MADDQPGGSSPAEQRRWYASYSLGLNLAVGMALFTLLGYWVDRRRGEGAYGWTVAGMVLGLGYSAYEVWRLIRILDDGPAPRIGRRRGDVEDPGGDSEGDR